MQTHQFTFGFVFGEGISSFPPGKNPTEADVVRRWVCEYDSRRGDQFRTGETFKHGVIFCVVDELIDFWKNNSSEAIRPRWKVFTKVKDLVTRVEPLKRFTRQRKDSESHKEWIENTLACFSEVFDISEVPEKRVLKKSKRFADEDFEVPGTSKSKRVFVVGLS